MRLCERDRRLPLVVDPQGHMSEEDHSRINAYFEKARGPDYRNGPPMYIISPNDRGGEGEDQKDSIQPESDTSGRKDSQKDGEIWGPTFTRQTPEWVVLRRVASLAKASHDHLMKCLASADDVTMDWAAVFHESSASFKSYSALLRVDPSFVVDVECSSTGSDLSLRTSKESEGQVESAYTRSMRQRSMGPMALRRKLYRNLTVGDEFPVLVSWTFLVYENIKPVLRYTVSHSRFLRFRSA